MAFFSRSNIQSGAASGLLRNHYCQTSCTNTQKVRHVYINIYIIIYIYKLGAHTHTHGVYVGKYNVMSITSYLLWPSVGWKLFKWLLHLSCTCGQVKLKIATSNKADTARSAFWAVPAEDVRRISEPKRSKSSKSHLPWTESVHMYKWGIRLTTVVLGQRQSLLTS